MNQREVGAKKEEQAGEYLKSCGYELEAKNYYCRLGFSNEIIYSSFLCNIFGCQRVVTEIGRASCRERV